MSAMFTRRSLLPIAFSLPLLAPDDGNPGGGREENPPATPPANDPPKVEFNADQQAKINDLLAAERKKTEERLQADAAKKEQEAKEKRERDEAEARGEFDQVKAELEGKVSTYEGELTTTKERLTTLEKLAQDRLDALLKDIPEEIAALGPDEETPIEKRLEWAEKAAKAAGVNESKRPGNGPNPNPSDGKFDQEAAVAQARASGRYNA